jgi:hypothetical protein
MQSPHYLLTMLLCIGSLSLGVAGQSYLRAEPSAISCYGNKDGSIRFEFIKEKPAEFQLQITDSLYRVVITLNSATGEPLLAANLPAGKYNIQLTAPEINEMQSVLIYGPEKLQLESIRIVELHGTGSSVTASLEAFPLGGTLPYTFYWSENTGNQKSRIAKMLSPGIYNCKVIDANNCGTMEATFFLFEDEIEKFNQENNTK